ncbi:hypothetical protein HJC23_001266 [Cyclotella cryptica]|uniref:Uncharacterized protein n=1 Tax=Cyclotella cryptica TaxID=29204 RepID=A0ABD3PDJ1_9STRA
MATVSYEPGRQRECNTILERSSSCLVLSAALATFNKRDQPRRLDGDRKRT